MSACHSGSRKLPARASYLFLLLTHLSCPPPSVADDPAFFRGHVSRFPFPDHHVPPLSLIPLMASDAKAWLLEHEDNTVVIHCKAGLGRSGTFACCLLLALDPALTGATSLRNASETEAIQMVSDALLRQGEDGDESSEFDVSSSRDDFSRGPSTSFSREMTSPPPGRPSLSQNRSDTGAEISERLKAVFDLHTSKRIKPVKGKENGKAEKERGEFPFAQKNSEEVTGDSGVAVEPLTRERSPRRIRSTKDLVSAVFNSGGQRSRSKSSSGTVVNGRPSSDLDFQQRENSNSTAQLSLEPTLASPSRRSFAAFGSHNLGASPRGVSTDFLPLSAEVLSEPRPSQSENGKPAFLGVDPSDQLRSRRSSSRNRARSKSPSPAGLPSDPNDIPTSNHQHQFPPNEILPSKPGVSIPSQRRWVGYFARILAGRDARLVFSSPCGFASPLPPTSPSSSSPSSSSQRRRIKITRISIERQAPAKGLPVRDNLSIQIGHYDDALVQRLETWERNARRRARAFGIHDPGAISPKTEDENKEMDFSSKQRSSSTTSLGAMASRIHSNGASTPSSFSRFHSNQGSSEWSLKINPQTEAERARNFDWGESDANGKQLVYGERLSETRRDPMDDEGGKMSRYVFIPGETSSTKAVETESERRGVILVPEAKKPSKSSIFGKRQRTETGKSEASPSVSLVPPTPPPPSSPALFEQPSSPSLFQKEQERSNQENGTSSSSTLIVDPDRELMVKVLVGRTGATHALLPDFTAAAWCWIIPSFEEPRKLVRPTHDEDEEGVGAVGQKVVKGSKTLIRLDKAELDFRKEALGVQSLEIEWEWIHG